MSDKIITEWAKFISSTTLLTKEINNKTIMKIKQSPFPRPFGLFLSSERFGEKSKLI